MFLAATVRTSGANVTFSPGAYVIDMGQSPQTPANGLKPYGLIYQLVVNNQVPVSWAINPNKVIDKNPTVTVEGADFTLRGKTYRGGPFIIPGEEVTAAVTNLIVTWRAKGVVVDGPITNGFTAPVFDVITAFPNTILDAQNGTKLITAFYSLSEVPASSYRLGGPRDLGVCDDIYGMPHSDPQNWDAATKAIFLNFVLSGGSLWASCHSVSALEGPGPNYSGFNFLSTTALIPWGAHLNRNTVPFGYNTNDPSIWVDPLMQFLGKVDLALQGGSEEIYVPDATGWAPHAKVAVFDKVYADSRQPWISQTDPSMAAADVVFGRAYNNTNYGSVVYVSSHAFQADGTAQNTAVGRTFGNLLLRTGIERKPNIVLNIPDNIMAGETVTISATITGRGAPHAIQWYSSIGGTFGDSHATTTTYTAPATAVSGAAVIRAAVNDSCNRSAFSTHVVEVIPAPGPDLHKTASWANAPGPVQAADQIDYQIKMDNYTNVTFLAGARITDFLPPNTAYQPASASPPLSSGPDPLVWQLGTNVAEVPGVSNGTVTNTLNATANTFDTYIDNGNKGRNYGGSTNVIVSGDGGHEKRALVRFDLSSIPAGAAVSSATLTLTKIGGTATASRNISVHRLTNDWTENSLNNVNGEANWNRRKTGINWVKAGSDFVAAGEGTNTVATANGPYSWDVSNAIAGAIASPGAATTNGFLLRYNISKLPNDNVIFGSSENSAGNGPKLVVTYIAGIGTVTRLTVSPYRLIGSQSSLPTVDVTMQVTVAGNSGSVTVTPPANLTVVASGGATATRQGGYPSPASLVVPAGGGTVTFTYKYDITSLGTAPGSLSFQGRPANADGATYVDATSNTILTVPTLNYSVLVNGPLPALVQRIPNTATFSDTTSFLPGVNDVTSAEVVVPVDNTNPDIGVAKAVSSITNLADGRYTVMFAFAVTNLGSVTLTNLRVGDNLNAAFAGHALSGLSVSATPNLTVNPSYNGVSDTNLLTGVNTLAGGAGGRIFLTVTVAAGSTLAYANQAVASATDISGAIPTSDLSDNGASPDPNDDGDPTAAGENDPTPVLLTENPAIGVTKYLTSAVKNPNGSFTIAYAISVENLGDVNLSGLGVGDKLTAAFPAPAIVSVDSLSSGQFVVNGGYNGGSDTNLLAPAQTLAAGAQGVINLTVTVNKNGGASVNFTNQATGTAISPAGQNVSASGTAGVTLELPGLVVTKQVTSIVPNGTNFSVTMRIDARNVGDVTLKDLQLTDDLDSAFSGVQSFTVTSKTATGATINTNFNGVSDINLLVGTNTLAMGATGSVFLTVRVVPDLGTSFENIAGGAGTSTNFGGETITSISEPATIAPSLVNGTLYLDHNTNGVFDAGDDFLPYVDIVITDSSNVTFTVTSDALGHFVAPVPPGSTTVNVNELDPQFPTNATPTVGSSDPTTVTVPANGASVADKGYVLPPSQGLVSGYVYLDFDGDGLPYPDEGDTPIVNVDVQIIDRNGVTNTVTTDSHGYFARVVAAGQAIVDVITADADFPAGKLLTVDDYNQGSDPTVVTVPDGGVATDNTGYVTADAGTGEVVGIVYVDRNTNGVFDVADSPLIGLSVAITDTNGVTVVVPTGPSGFYSLIVDAGLTVVNVVTNNAAFPAGATATIGTTNPTTLNVPDGGTGRDDNGFLLPAGMGLVRGFVYIDNNDDGIYQRGSDGPIPDITINITDTNGVVQPVVTDEDGFYSLIVTNGVTLVDVVTGDADFPAALNLTTDAHNEGSDPTAVVVPSGGVAADNTGYTFLNRVPSAVNDLAYTTENTPLSGNVLLNDNPGDRPISSLTILANGSHGTAVLNLNGNYTYTPVPGYSGTDSFVYQLCDANGDCAAATVTVRVNSLPVANNDNPAVAEDTALSGNVAGNDIPSSDGGNVWSLVTPATNGVVIFNSNGTYSYQPNPDYHGTDTFRYRLCDVDGDCATGMVSIAVTSVNDGPVAVNGTTNTLEDVPVTIHVLLNVSDVDGDTLTIISVSPTNGTASISGTNIVFTPATNFTGTATIGYTVSDGNGGTNTAVITVTVGAVNDPPVAVNDATNTVENVSVTISPLLNDSDLEGDTLTITSVSPTNGTASISGTNIVFTPATNFAGTATIGYTVGDGNGGTNMALITVTVTPQSDIVVLKTGPASGTVGSSLTFTLLVTNSDLLTATNVVVFDQLPAGYTFVSATPTEAGVSNGLVRWPAMDVPGLGSASYTVTATPGGNGAFTNIGFATTTSPDRNPGNNSGTDPGSRVTTTVGVQADLEVTVSGPATVLAGANFIYTVCVTNLGPSVATNALATNQLPGGVVFVSAGSGGTHSNNAVTWPALTLAAGAGTNYALTVTAPASGSLTNIAAGNSATPDPNLANNDGTAGSAVVMTGVIPQADVAVGKSGPATAQATSNLTYTISLTNLGPSTASNVIAADNLPGTVTFLSASGGGTLGGGNVVTWPAVTLGAGMVTNFSVTVIAPLSGSITNVASASSPTGDPNDSNNSGTNSSARVTTTVLTGPAFGILAATAVFNPQTGLFEQRATVTNTGPATVAAVRLYVSGLRSNVFFHNPSGTNAGVAYAQYNSPLNPAQTVVFTLEFYVPDRRPFTNTLTAEAVLPTPAQTNSGNGLNISRAFVDARLPGNARFVIEFPTVPGRVYTILYSDDMATWKAATPSVTASSTSTQWYDDGPPKTQSKPLTGGSRYYRVVVSPTP